MTGCSIILGHHLSAEYRFMWRAMRWKMLVSGDCLPIETDEFDLMMVWSMS